MHVACFVDVKRFFIIFHYIAIVKVFSYKNGTGLIWRVGKPHCHSLCGFAVTGIVQRIL
jgi:hypothetical protein